MHSFEGVKPERGRAFPKGIPVIHLASVAPAGSMPEGRGFPMGSRIFRPRNCSRNALERTGSTEGETRPRGEDRGRSGVDTPECSSQAEVPDSNATHSARTE